MEIELFQVCEGWGYRVGGIYQEFDPECEGFTIMSEARARECAEAVLLRLTSK